MGLQYQNETLMMISPNMLFLKYIHKDTNVIFNKTYINSNLVELILFHLS